MRKPEVHTCYFQGAETIIQGSPCAGATEVNVYWTEAHSALWSAMLCLGQGTGSRW